MILFRSYILAWVSYQIVSQDTLCAYEVEEKIRFLKGICLHRKDLDELDLNPDPQTLSELIRRYQGVTDNGPPYSQLKLLTLN